MILTEMKQKTDLRHQVTKLGERQASIDLLHLVPETQSDPSVPPRGLAMFTTQVGSKQEHNTKHSLLPPLQHIPEANMLHEG